MNQNEIKKTVQKPKTDKDVVAIRIKGEPTEKGKTNVLWNTWISLLLTK